MSRPTDTERGARIAAGMANAMLNAHYQPNLFPQRLKPKQLQLWKSIAASSAEQLEECAAMRQVRSAC